MLIALVLVGCGGTGDARSGSAVPATVARPSPRPGAHHLVPPDPEPGSKAAAPGVPTSRQGDNSIQTWGIEASDALRHRIAALVHSYLNARASRDWAKVCAGLNAKLRHEQGLYADGAPCPQAMASYAIRAHDSVLRSEADIEVLSLRVGRAAAFLVYRRADGVWALALKREGGRWRLVTATPTSVG